jgi:hypothetical protein
VGFVYDTDGIDAFVWELKCADHRISSGAVVHRSRKYEYVRAGAEFVITVASEQTATEVKRMGASGLADIRERLLAEQERTTQELEAARLKVEELEAELEQVRQMLAVGEKRRGRGKTRTKRRAASCDVVSEAIAFVLRHKGVVAEKELTQLVRKRLGKSGHSLTGLAPRLREALRDDRFIESVGGYRLELEESFGAESKERLPGPVPSPVISSAPESGA